MSDYSTLLAVLETTPPGSPFTVDTWREEAALAQLNGAQKRECHKRAVEHGYLTPIGVWIGGQWSANMIRTTHPEGRARWIELYWRTDKKVAAQPEAVAS